MREFGEEYINRDLAVYLLNKFASSDNQPRAIRRAAKYLQKFPASDVRQNVFGRWIYNETNDIFECSVCKGAAPRNDYPYCHWCGAYMKSPVMENPADKGGDTDE